MSHLKYGPVLYGIFGDGRVEELLEGSVYPGERLRDPLIEREVANAYARFHSLNLPLPDKTIFCQIVDAFGVSGVITKYEPIVLFVADVSSPLSF